MIQRYDMPGGSIEVALHTGELVPSPDGELMLYSDHVKAMKGLDDGLVAFYGEHLAAMKALQLDKAELTAALKRLIASLGGISEHCHEMGLTAEQARKISRAYAGAQVALVLNP
jgi:hypothetical protein